MTLLSRATITCVNLEQLDRIARDERITARDVCAALMPEQATATRRANPPTAPDYIVLTVGEIEKRAAAATPNVRSVLQKVVAAAKANEAYDIVFPCSSARLGAGGMPVLAAPAFVRSAKTVEPLLNTPQAPPSALEDGEAVRASIEKAKHWMKPHLNGFEVAVARAARSLSVGPLRAAIRGESLAHRSLHLYTSCLALGIALNTRDRVGGGEPAAHALLAFALLRLLAERVFPDEEKPDTSVLGEILYELVAYRSIAGRDSFSNMFHNLERVAPRTESTFGCPPDEVNESLVAACVQIVMENDRIDRERTALGLSGGDE